MSVRDLADATQEKVNDALDALTKAKAGLTQKEESTNPNEGNDKPSHSDNGNSNSGDKTNDSSKGNGNTNTDSKTQNTQKSAKTGDDSAIALFATLSLLSAGTFTVLRRRREN